MLYLDNLQVLEPSVSFFTNAEATLIAAESMPSSPKAGPKSAPEYI